jgi:peptidyl-prolyl cis-trans isomerase C
MKLVPALLWAAGACLLAQTPAQPPAQPPLAGPTEVPYAPNRIDLAEFAVMPKDKVLVEVNGVKITAADMDSILKAYPENTRVYILGPGRQNFFDQLVRVLVLSDEGKRRKIDEDPEYKAQALYSLAGILGSHTNEDLKNKIVLDDAAMMKYYQDHETDYTRLKARHILVRMKGSAVPVRPGQDDLTEEQALAKAKELQAKIRAGADFADVARTESDDATSGAKGGDLGVFGRGQMVPSFEEAAFQLKAGEMSDPVKSPAGFHIIQVQERQVKSLEEVKSEIDTKLRAEMLKKQIDALVNKANVILAPELLPASKMAK